MTLEAAELRSRRRERAQTGDSSDAYQVLGAFAKEAGSDVGSVHRSPNAVRRIVTPPRDGAAFQRIGIRAKNQGMSPEEVFYKVGGAIGELTDQQVKQEVTAKLMGRGGQELIPSLRWR